MLSPTQSHSPLGHPKQTPRLILFWLAVTCPLTAAATPNQNLLDMSIEDLLSITVTSSTLTNENLPSVPASITVYTRADIRRLGLMNLAELVNYVPGFQSYRSDTSSLNHNISARGRSVGNAGAEVLILIDGLRLNSDWHGGAGYVNNLISLENIERVEFIRGPGSAIYGSNAMTGVINITTRSQRELRLAAGSHQQGQSSLQWHGQGADSKLDIYARSEQSDGQDYHLYNPSSASMQSRRAPYSAHDLYVRGELGEFSLAARYSRSDTQEFYAVGFTDANAYFDTSTHSTNLGWRHDFHDHLSLDGRLFSSYKRYGGRAAVTANGQLVYEGRMVEREQGTQWILQGDTTTSRWLLGWEWRNPELIDTASHLGTPADPYAIAPQILEAPENGRRINSSFIQLQRELTARLHLTTGLRHDHYSDFGGHFSPRIALVHQADNNSIKLLYSEAFRAPSRLESSVINQVTIVQNPELKPETAKTTELVWIHSFNSGLVSTSLFDTQVKDAIVDSVVSAPTLKRKPINSDLSVAGVEVEWQQQWTSDWRACVAFTHYFDSVGAIHTQSNSLLGGSLSYAKGKWNASLLVNYQGSILDPNEQDRPSDITTTETTHLPGYTLVNLHLSYQFSNDTELYMQGDNLFDKTYFSPAVRPENYLGVPGAGRSWRLGMRWSF